MAAPNPRPIYRPTETNRTFLELDAVVRHQIYREVFDVFHHRQNGAMSLVKKNRPATGEKANRLNILQVCRQTYNEACGLFYSMRPIKTVWDENNPDFKNIMSRLPPNRLNSIRSLVVYVDQLRFATAVCRYLNRLGGLRDVLIVQELRNLTVQPASTIQTRLTEQFHAERRIMTNAVKQLKLESMQFGVHEVCFGPRPGPAMGWAAWAAAVNDFKRPDILAFQAAVQAIFHRGEIGGPQGSGNSDDDDSEGDEEDEDEDEDEDDMDVDEDGEDEEEDERDEQGDGDDDDDDRMDEDVDDDEYTTTEDEEE